MEVLKKKLENFTNPVSIGQTLTPVAQWRGLGSRLQSNNSKPVNDKNWVMFKIGLEINTSPPQLCRNTPGCFMKHLRRQSPFAASEQDARTACTVVKLSSSRTLCVSSKPSSLRKKWNKIKTSMWEIQLTSCSKSWGLWGVFTISCRSLQLKRSFSASSQSSSSFRTCSMAFSASL